MKLYFLLFSTFIILQCSHSVQSQGTNEGQSSEDNNSGAEAREKKKFRLAIISDLNGSYGSTQYSNDVKSAVNYIIDPLNKVDFVLSTGDMVAGQKSNLNYQAMWDSFHKAVTRPIIKEKIPIFPSPGNHDAYLGREIERTHYKNNWLKESILPTSEHFSFVKNVEQNFPFQYAFKMGNALFIGLDNTAAKPWTDKTYQWLEKVLSQEVDTNIKMIYGHVPLLPFAFQKETEYVARGSVSFLNEIEALFAKYKVDVFFSGHSHVYYPGRRDIGTQYISVPLLGSGTRFILSNENLPRSSTAFLLIDFDSEGGWSLKHIDAKTSKEVSDQSFPESVVMPSKNSTECSSCTSFPKTHFLDPIKRIIYQRRDL